MKFKTMVMREAWPVLCKHLPLKMLAIFSLLIGLTVGANAKVENKIPVELENSSVVISGTLSDSKGQPLPGVTI